MYQLIGPWKLITIFGTVAAFVALVISWIWPISEIPELWRIASLSVTCSGFLVLLLGQTAIFPRLCRLPLVRIYLPPIDGTWTGEFTSNFPQIAKAFKLSPDSLGKPVVAEFTIIARLFDVRISSLSVSPRPGYMRSDTTAFRIAKSSHTHRNVIHYVFDAVVDAPEPSDVDRFYGAARLEILGDGKGMTLQGAYWTDRNWQTGQNTAGTLKLRRKV